MAAEAVEKRDILVIAKTIATTRFPFEAASLGGVDRASGRWLRVSPFPFSERDSTPPIPKWTWIEAATRRSTTDPRPESIEVADGIVSAGYVEAKEAWRFRWPFVRPHLRDSLEALAELSRAGVATTGFVRPSEAELELDALALRMRCLSDTCRERHLLPILDWEIRETTRALHERDPLGWRPKAEAMWGRALFERYDVHVLLSSYAQAPARFYVAGLFYPPREAESVEAHAAHARGRPG